MSRHNFVAGVFRGLGDKLGIAPLELDDADRVSLLFDGVLVTFAYTTDPIELVWIYVDLGEVPPHGVIAPQRLLQLGFEFWAKNVMTIGMDEVGRNAIGYSSIPVSLVDVAVLQELLDHMLQAAFLIREQLASVEFDVSQTDGSADHIDPMAAFGNLC